MTTFLWTLLILEAISLVARLYYLGTSTYPRQSETSALGEGFSIVITCGMIGWIIYLM